MASRSTSSRHINANVDAEYADDLDSASSDGSPISTDDEEVPKDECRDQRSLRFYAYVFLRQQAVGPLSLQRASFVYQVLSAAAIVGLFLVDSTTEPTVTTKEYYHLELMVTVLWVIEYILLIWCSVEESNPVPDSFNGRCRLRLLHCLTSTAILDLISIVSLIIDLSIESNQLRGLSALRMLRFFTLFRIERQFHLFSPVLFVLRSEAPLFAATIGIALTLLLVSSVVMFYIESPYNPGFHNVLSSMWWGTTALTTVGYGDVYPTTSLGRFVGSIVAFLGVGLFALPAGILTQGFNKAWKRAQAEKRAHRRKLVRGEQTSNDAVEAAVYEDEVARPSDVAKCSEEIAQVIARRLEANLDLRFHELNRRVDALQADMDCLKSELRSNRS